MAKISLISTVYNEERSIQSFLDSIFAQSRKPDEVVIVDARSTDTTWRLLKDATSKFKKAGIEYVTFCSKGNRSYGRNYAIKRAKHDWIAVSDAGCILDKDWLKHLDGKSKGVDVVSGYYSSDYDNPTHFQKALASYTCIMPDQLHPENFLPSSRSVMFTKSAWQSAGQYPEHLDLCEDLVFARKLKDAGYRFAMSEKALVYWPQKLDLWSAAKQFYGYAYGDGQARYFRKQTPLLFGRYIVGLLLLNWVVQSDASFFFIIVPLLLYILWAIQKNYRYVNSWRALYLLPALQFAADFAVMFGMLRGMLRPKIVR